MSERQYMSIKDFIEKYPIDNLINNDKTIDRVNNAYWFSFIQFSFIQFSFIIIVFSLTTWLSYYQEKNSFNSQ